MKYISKLTNLLEKKISKKVGLTFVCIFVVQILVAFQPITWAIYPWIGGTKSDFRKLVQFEILTFPIVLFITALYLIQVLNWSWLKKKAFGITYIISLILGVVSLMFARDFEFFEVLMYINLFVGQYPAALVLELFGWLPTTKETIFFAIGLATIVFSPFIWGLIGSLIYTKGFKK